MCLSTWAACGGGKDILSISTVKIFSLTSPVAPEILGQSLVTFSSYVSFQIYCQQAAFKYIVVTHLISKPHQDFIAILSCQWVVQQRVNISHNEHVSGISFLSRSMEPRQLSSQRKIATGKKMCFLVIPQVFFGGGDLFSKDCSPHQRKQATLPQSLSSTGLICRTC